MSYNGSHLFSIKSNVGMIKVKEKKKGFPLNIFEIILLIISIPILFFYSGKLFCQFENSSIFDWFVGFWGPLIIIGFNIFWIASMMLWHLNLRIKIYFTVFIVTISAMLIVSWMAATAFRGSMH